MIISAQKSKKEDNHDTLCEELLRERAAVLSRAGMAVEDAIAELNRLDEEIAAKNIQLHSLARLDSDPEKAARQQALICETNMTIEQFNKVQKRAELKYYYLIVTREALGLRRHNIIQETYIIPGKKKG
jgi:hypothetical protein